MDPKRGNTGLSVQLPAIQYNLSGVVIGRFFLTFRRHRQVQEQTGFTGALVKELSGVESGLLTSNFHCLSGVEWGCHSPRLDEWHRVQGPNCVQLPAIQSKFSGVEWGVWPLKLIRPAVCRSCPFNENAQEKRDDDDRGSVSDVFRQSA